MNATKTSGPDVERTPDNDPMVRACLEEGARAEEILLIDCPHCGAPSYYSGGFTSGCSWCGRDIARYSDDAYTLADYRGQPFPDEVLP